MTEDGMAGWHHQLDGYEFEQAPGVGDGQGSLACCSPCGHKESDMIQRLSNKNTNLLELLPPSPLPQMQTPNTGGWETTPTLTHC